jgi:hypothetical protein
VSVGRFALKRLFACVVGPSDAEARGQRDDARRHFTPSMSQRIDVVRLYQEALRRMPETIDGQLPVPQACSAMLEVDYAFKARVMTSVGTLAVNGCSRTPGVQF